MFIRLLKSMLVISTVIIITVSATKAAWNDSATVDNNFFQAGTLDIATTPVSKLFDTSLSPIYPGWKISKQMVVTNSGTIPLTYQISSSNTSGDDLLFKSDKFLLSIGTTQDGGDIYGGSSGSSMNLLSTTGRTLEAGKSETLYFTASLDSTAENELQNKNTSVSFTFSAN